MMNKKQSASRVMSAFLVGLILLVGSGQQANAQLNPTNFTEDLNQLVLDGNLLLASMESVTLQSLTMTTQLATLENSTQIYLNSVGDVYKMVSSSTDNTTMSLTNEMLIPLQTLSAITASLTQSLAGLAGQVATLSSFTALSSLESSLITMLRLSDDIGVMADRIIEMSDQILIMADNIGLMADRILATQVIQSDNLQVMVAASLETQKNILLLFSMFF